MGKRRKKSTDSQHLIGVRKTNDSKPVRWHLTEVNSKLWFQVLDSNCIGSGVCTQPSPPTPHQMR